MANMLFEANEWLSHPDRILAVVGGGAVGGLGFGWLVQMAVRGWTGQQVPRGILITLRVIAAGVSGWLVALWLFSTGGGGLGGAGGTGFGGNTDSTHTSTDTSKGKTEPERPHEDVSTRNVTTLEVEVLGSEALRELGGKQADVNRCYRIKTPMGPRLLTLNEAEEYIKQQSQEKPPLESILIVLYNNSPSRNVPRVSELAGWVELLSIGNGEKRVTVGYSTRKSNAPTQ